MDQNDDVTGRACSIKITPSDDQDSCDNFIQTVDGNLQNEILINLEKKISKILRSQNLAGEHTRGGQGFKCFQHRTNVRSDKGYASSIIGGKLPFKITSFPGSP
jgi:hypothetical protein